MTEPRTAIFARRRQLKSTPAGTFSWPLFLVSAPHRVATASTEGPPWVPYGPWHARRVGTLETACGRGAVGWPFFWTLDFMQAGARSCVDCQHVVLAGRHRPRVGDDPTLT